MNNITKKDIIDSISAKTGLTQIDTKVLTEAFMQAITKSLCEGRDIELRGFGRFKIKERKARIARNPKTDKKVNVEKGLKPKFEASRELKRRVNNSFIE